MVKKLLYTDVYCCLLKRRPFENDRLLHPLLDYIIDLFWVHNGQCIALQPLCPYLTAVVLYRGCFFIEFYSMSFCGLTDIIKFLAESFSTEFIGILRFCLLRLSGFDIVIGCRKL